MDSSPRRQALKLLIGGPHLVYVVLFGVICVVTQIVLQYTRYVAVLKWLTLSLFTYVAALFAVHTPWGEALKGLLVPHVQLSSAFMTTLVAILGTTISPYLFFWQAAQEAEDTRVKPERTPLRWSRRQAPIALARIRADTLAGMAFSNLIAVAIVITTAATLHVNGVTNVETSAQAAEAPTPIAGEFASLIFTLRIVGTGLVAVPVLAGSAAYPVGESRRWPTGLSRGPREAWAFYSTLGIATELGVLMNFTSLNPIRALYWSAVINGVVAVPVMIILMLMTRRSEIMGQFTGSADWG